MPAKDQGFSEDQIEDFKEVFQLFDTKGDGLIQVSPAVIITHKYRRAALPRTDQDRFRAPGGSTTEFRARTRTRT